MRLTLFFLLLVLLSIQSVFADEWTCTEVASIKEGNKVLVCGVATEGDEGSAREQALLRAQREFKLICEGSSDCRGRETNIEPLRNTCSQLEDGRYKCYRGLRYVILEERMDDNFDDEFNSQPVAAVPRSTRRLQGSRWAFGMAMFDINVNDKDGDIKRSFSGATVLMKYSITDHIGLRFDLSRVVGDKDKSNKITSFEYMVVLGRKLITPGFQAYFSVGGFASKWETIRLANENVDDLAFNFGLGWNARKWNIFFEAGSYINEKLEETFNVDSGTDNFRLGLTYRL